MKVHSPNDLSRWLADEPADWAQAIAARAALRVASLFGPAVSGGVDGALRLAVWRAVFISWAACKYPTRIVIAYAAAARTAAYAAARATGNSAAYAAAAPYAAEAAASAANAADHDYAASVWRTIGRDCDYLETLRDRQAAAEALIGMPLWLEIDDHGRGSAYSMPQWASEALTRLEDNADLGAAGYDIWHKWYRSIVAGTASGGSHFGSELDVRIALQPSDWWERDPSIVNAEIKAWMEDAKRIAALEGALEPRLGDVWEPRGGHLQIRSEGNIDDQRVASQPETVELYQSLMRRCRAFSPVGKTIEDTYGWEGFSDAFQRFEDAYSCAADRPDTTVTRLYDTALEFGSYLEFDNDLRKRGGGNVTALSPQHRRAYVELVRSVAQWIRRFPSARATDEELGGFAGRISEALAASLVDSAAGQGVITDADRALMAALIAAMQRSGLPAEKAAYRGYFSVRNLVVAAALFVAGGAAEKTDLYGNITEWLKTRANEVVAIVAEAPDDVRGIINQMLDEIGEGKPEDEFHLPSPNGGARNRIRSSRSGWR